MYLWKSASDQQRQISMTILYILVFYGQNQLHVSLSPFLQIVYLTLNQFIHMFIVLHDVNLIIYFVSPLLIDIRHRLVVVGENIFLLKQFF